MPVDGSGSLERQKTLHYAADSVTNAMSSLVKELKTGRSTNQLLRRSVVVIDHPVRHDSVCLLLVLSPVLHWNDLLFNRCCCCGGLCPIPFVGSCNFQEDRHRVKRLIRKWRVTRGRRRRRMWRRVV